MRILVACLLLAWSAPVWAEEPQAQPILLWNFQKECDPLPEAAREVQKWLDSTVTKPYAKTYVLNPDQQLLGCEGAACAALVRRACPSAQGRIMGGIVDQNASHSLLRVRLWMYDPQTGKTFYHDNYCQNCTISSTLKINAAELAQSGTIETPGSTPIYCRPDAPVKEPPPGSNKIFWTVFGKEHHKEALRATIRKLVQQTGTEVPFDYEGKDYTTASLRKVIAKEPGAQVFGAQIQGNGKIEIFLYDGPTELLEVQNVDCDACDKDSLMQQVSQTGLSVLTHCFGDSCAQASHARPPAEACRPFEIPRCGGAGGEQLPLVPSRPDSKPPTSPASFEVSPSAAKLIKGAVWGFFASSAVTTAALLATNYTSAGHVDAGSQTVSNLMLPGAAATGVLTIISLGIAIPTTILIDRSTAGQSSGAADHKKSAEPSLGSFLMQCPN
jgi:hypothetical protein